MGSKIGIFAAMHNEIKSDDLEYFAEGPGMPGFSPIQGHIASAVPLLGHALKEIMVGEMNYTMFLPKGSLFLRHMTHLSDRISFLLEKMEKGDKLAIELNWDNYEGEILNVET